MSDQSVKITPKKAKGVPKRKRMVTEKRIEQLKRAREAKRMKRLQQQQQNQASDADRTPTKVDESDRSIVVDKPTPTVFASVDPTKDQVAPPESDQAPAPAGLNTSSSGTPAIPVVLPPVEKGVVQGEDMSRKRHLSKKDEEEMLFLLREQGVVTKKFENFMNDFDRNLGLLLDKHLNAKKTLDESGVKLKDTTYDPAIKETPSGPSNNPPPLKPRTFAGIADYYNHSNGYGSFW